MQDNGFAVRHDGVDHEEHLDGQGSRVTRRLVGKTEGFVERALERKHSSSHAVMPAGWACLERQLQHRVEVVWMQTHKLVQSKRLEDSLCEGIRAR